LRNGLDSLAGARARLGAIEVAGRPESLLIDVEATEEERFDREDNPLDLRFQATAFVVIQDGNQMLHRLNAGKFASATGPATLAVPLVAVGPDGSLLAPSYPISIVAIEFRMSAPPFPIGDVTISIQNLRATYERDTVEPVLADMSSSEWRAGVHPQGQLAGDATIADAAAQPDHGRRLQLDPGWSRSSVAVLVELRARSSELPEAVPVVVSDLWLAANNSEIGDIIDLPALQLLDSSARIVGSIARFPTVDPRTANVMVFDLATVQMMDFDVARPIREASEYWLRLDDNNDSLRRQLESPPFDTVELTFKSERTDELLTDPPALGLIGALSIGAAAAAVFAVVGLLVSFALSMRERANEFALLEALGLSMHQLGRWLLTERALLVWVAMAIGTGLGLLMSALVLPLIALTQDGGEVIPTPIVVFPWSTIATVELAVIGALSMGAGLINLLSRRPSPAAVLRSGDGT
jgi:hypothetical protein